MPHLFAFRPEISSEISVELDLQRHAIDYLQTAALERAKFFRVVGHKANAPDAEIMKNFGTLIVVPKIDLETEFPICLDRVGTRVLQLVSTYLVYYTDAAALLVLIDDRSAASFGDQLHCGIELLPAIALCRPKNVTCQTLRMDPRKCWLIFTKLAACNDNKFLIRDERTVSDDAKHPELGREFRLGDPFNGAPASGRIVADRLAYVYLSVKHLFVLWRRASSSPSFAKIEAYLS